MSDSQETPRVPTSVIVWLWSILAMVSAMVIVGGITRLTGSGLSMVEWRPLIGWLPPTSAAEWERVFGLYQESPQFEQVNHWMDLAEFKAIFFWEYFHRLLGRLIGVVFFVPWLVFLVKRRIRGSVIVQTLILGVLGGGQGLLGWYMVKSGLVEDPHVSHFRLAAHLSLALVIAAYAYWLILSFRRGSRKIWPGPALLGWVVFSIISVQVVYGAFMAGTRAGFLSRTFPDMNGEWIPSAVSQAPDLLNALLYDPMAIHFAHRVLGVVALIAGIMWTVRLFRAKLKGSAGLFLGAMLLQFGLGVATVWFGVPIWLAATHQGGAILLLGAALSAIHYRTPARGDH